MSGETHEDTGTRGTTDTSERAGTQPSLDRATILDRLDDVRDPELDRSIVALEYIETIRIDDGRVTVRFVLPTAWCSPTFAWMMATDIRDRIRTLPTVESVHVELLDHMHDEGINRGVNRDLAFDEVFEDAADDVAAVRQTLDRKARHTRQYHAVEHLLDAGLDPGQIVALTPADLEMADERVVIYLRDGTVGVEVAATPIRSYLEKAREVGVVTDPDDPLFADLDGSPIDPRAFESVHREMRLSNTNMSGQAGICAQLHEARNGVDLDEV